MSLCLEHPYIRNLSKTRGLKLLGLLEFGWWRVHKSATVSHTGILLVCLCTHNPVFVSINLYLSISIYMYVGYSLFLLHSDNISRTCYKNLYGRPCIQDFWASANLAPSQVSLASFNGPKKKDLKPGIQVLNSIMTSLSTCLSKIINCWLYTVFNHDHEWSVVTLVVYPKIFSALCPLCLLMFVSWLRSPVCISTKTTEPSHGKGFIFCR